MNAVLVGQPPGISRGKKRRKKKIADLINFSGRGKEKRKKGEGGESFEDALDVRNCKYPAFSYTCLRKKGKSVARCPMVFFCRPEKEKKKGDNQSPSRKKKGKKIFELEKKEKGEGGRRSCQWGGNLLERPLIKAKGRGKPIPPNCIPQFANGGKKGKERREKPRKAASFSQDGEGEVKNVQIGFCHALGDQKNK